MDIVPKFQYAEEEEEFLINLHDNYGMSVKATKPGESREQKAFNALYHRCAKRRLRNGMPPLFGNTRYKELPYRPKPIQLEIISEGESDNESSHEEERQEKSEDLTIIINVPRGSGPPEVTSSRSSAPKPEATKVSLPINRPPGPPGSYKIIPAVTSLPKGGGGLSLTKHHPNVNLSPLRQTTEEALRKSISPREREERERARRKELGLDKPVELLDWDFRHPPTNFVREVKKELTLAEIEEFQAELE